MSQVENNIAYTWYNFTVNPDVQLPLIKTVHHGAESISYFVSNIWGMIFTEIKEANSINKFKKLTKIGSRNALTDFANHALMLSAFLT